MNKNSFFTYTEFVSAYREAIKVAEVKHKEYMYSVKHIFINNASHLLMLFLEDNDKGLYSLITDENTIKESFEWEIKKHKKYGNNEIIIE